MAARFYKGASLGTTSSTKQEGKSPAVQSNSMHGMPGRIKTGQDASSAGLASSPGVGIKKAGPIGQKGGPHRANQQKGKGSTDTSYRATSTGPAGKIVGSGKMESLKGRARTSWEK
jgi:hypothetical protein